LSSIDFEHMITVHRFTACCYGLVSGKIVFLNIQPNERKDYVVVKNIMQINEDYSLTTIENTVTRLKINVIFEGYPNFSVSNLIHI
jgi:hypothetical protein